MPPLRLYLVHHGPAVSAALDSRQPLSASGRELVERLAAVCALRAVSPGVVWHSGKLRARQTAEIYWRACNALAAFAATRDLQPTDDPRFMRDRLRFESRDLLVVGHFPHLPALLRALLTRSTEEALFPTHGVVAMSTGDDGTTWTEDWRLAADDVLDKTASAEAEENP